MGIVKLVMLDHASPDDDPRMFRVHYDSERFKITEDQKGDPLIMRCPRTGNIYMAISEPEGLMIKYPCGTKHFIKYE